MTNKTVYIKENELKLVKNTCDKIEKYTLCIQTGFICFWNTYHF